MKTYKLKIPHSEKPEEMPLNRISATDEDEGLTGYIGEWEASDIEERFGRSLAKEEKQFSFREHFFGPTRTTPGAIEVDFLVWVGNQIYPIFIDGEYAHKSQAQRDSDMIKGAIFDDYGKNFGLQPSQRIPGSLLGNQDASDEIVKEMF